MTRYASTTTITLYASVQFAHAEKPQEASTQTSHEVLQVPVSIEENPRSSEILQVGFFNQVRDRTDSESNRGLHDSLLVSQEHKSSTSPIAISRGTEDSVLIPGEA